MSTTRKKSSAPPATASRKELGNRLRTTRQRQDAQDIITIRSRKTDKKISLDTVLRKHRSDR